MHRAWVALLLAGCGFQSNNNGKPDNEVPDAAVDALEVVTNCWAIHDNSYMINWSKCTTAIAPELHITEDLVVNTSDAKQCATVASNGEGVEVCALVAKKIILDEGRTLRATGALPLALFGNAIELRGTIDVASHVAGTLGAGANDAGCNLPTQAGPGGGGAGGTFENTSDGKGGGQDGGDAAGEDTDDTGGKAIGSITDKRLRGGCFGRRGALPTASANALGGAGGGAVWIAANEGALTIAATAVINASGAGGLGGAQPNQGGDGGGAGGFIVLEADTIDVSPPAQIFANGGDGGAGHDGTTAGANGLDPTTPMGSAAVLPSDTAGTGGFGYPRAHAGENGKGEGGGGGGGGGGLGAIRFVTPKLELPSNPNISPPAQRWAPRP